MRALRDSRRVFVVGLAAAALAVAFSIGVLVAAVAENSEVAVSAKSLAERIQRERARNIRESCEAQNARNRTARAYLRGLPRSATRDQRERFATSAADAIVGPVRDCDRLVERQVPGAETR
jgi:hypothetical protein